MDVRTTEVVAASVNMLLVLNPELNDLADFFVPLKNDLGVVTPIAIWLIRCHEVLGPVLLLYCQALLFLRMDVGLALAQCLHQKISGIFGMLNEGANFVFGHLAMGIDMTEHLGALVRNPGNNTRVYPVFAFS
ncbi:hypothetical protein HPB47_014093, partial [Ixodes persulcatus]